MQFIPSSWESYGVDANGDGVRDPYNPEDAIFAAASYLSASGMPANTYSAIFAYNHADWYVADVLANASCYGGMAAASGGTFALRTAAAGPRMRAAEGLAGEGARRYMEAFEAAASRYGLGSRGVWALAADRATGVELRRAG